ncbi:hypothetical protein ABH931_002442 [Streptacidiphilus sp. MAP12-33]|uniref:DUF6817 domain-containing protein n=1 Tax=Streptacidiphilus sp. MAP12-33 TaxID=3156266 RepID=UPI003516569A
MHQSTPAATEFLRQRGAARLPHPGGTLLTHLLRVARLLDAWGADPDVQIAGLCHAAYGTDGFDQALVEPAERELLVELIGERAEALVRLYAGCDRGFVYPQVGGGRPVVFRDRFTGREFVPAEPELRGFWGITAANELDVLAHNPELADRYGSALCGLFARAGELLPAPAREAWARQLGAPDGPCAR